MGGLLGSQQCCLHYFVGPHLHSSRNADELTGFQISWIGLRSTFFHLPRTRASICCKLEREVMERGWGTREDKNTKLVHALAKYQSHIHPRGFRATKKTSRC
jgi:hypothetical protein